eukprot:g34077.t1
MTEGIYEHIMLAGEERLAEEQQDFACSPGKMSVATFQLSGQAEEKHQRGNLSPYEDAESQETWEEKASSIHVTKTGLMSGQNSPPLTKQELKTVESLDERLVLPEKAYKKLKNDWEECSKRDGCLAPDSDLSSCGLGGFVSEENLRFSGNEAPDRYSLMEKRHLDWNISINSHSESRESVPDKLSEEVDEIWNDLEDYIRKSEETRRDRLPAAFPVSEDDLRGPVSSRGSRKERSTKVSPSFVEAVKNKSGRLSTSIVKTDNSEPSGEASVITASVASFLDGVAIETESLWGSTNAETVQDLDIMDRTKRRVYYMARQYSQKIKKANQLLKMKNTSEQSPSDQPKRKCKDLVAILEEKKQGGTAI